MPTELIRERVKIPGPCASLAGELAYPFGETSFSCLVANAHPHMGGATGNRLIVRIVETLASAGGIVLSFDYSGIGESDGARIDVADSMSKFWQNGVAPEDPRMVADTRSAFEWISKVADVPLFAVGYSFGAYTATAVLPDNMIGLALIAPTITQHDFSPLVNRHIAKLIVHSDNDFATPLPELENWMRGLPSPLASLCVQSGDHFFRGQEDEVAQACRDFILQYARKDLQ